MSEKSNIIKFIQSLKAEYNENELYFTNKQLQRTKVSKPYKGISILQNIPFTREALIKLEPIIEGGAEVTVTCPSFMEPDPILIEAFIQSGGNFIELEKLENEVFDIHLDCAAELLFKVAPKIGTVEITGTGSNKYRDRETNYPVISIDLCDIKNLEGTLGTGEAFVRAFKEITKQNIHNKPFMIFGYGKVGRGMAHYLKADNAQVTIIDRDDSLLKKANNAGFKTIQANNKIEVENAAENMFCIATATGRENIISDNYNTKTFKNKYLANMGGDDEFGYHFKDDEVLCEKKPINFSTSIPTLLRYLDPVFYAHNMGIDLLLYSNLKNGLHPFPSFIAEETVQEWIKIFNEKIPSD